MKQIFLPKFGPISLEPFAAMVDFQFTSPMLGNTLETMLLEYIRELGQRCDDKDGSIIGHIKALGIFPDKSHIRLSLVSVAHPPEKEGTVPDDKQDIQITLNVLVYGVPAVLLESIAMDTALFIGEKWSCNVATTPLETR